MNNQIIYVPLNKLEVDPLNVRKTYSQESIAEFAASIEAKGILQNVLGRKAKTKGHYYVSAGGRRLRAARLLAGAGKIAMDTPVPLREITEAEAQELSLAENIMREGMNPADQFEAFRDLEDNGKSVSDIAVHFGTTETIVRKRLALGRVAPDLREIFRQGKMKLEELSAFTITDDHAEQLRVWEALPSYNRSAYQIKHALSEGGVRATDKRIRFIGGLDAYEAAGGAVKRDLFDDDGGYAIDGALLDRLVSEKFETIAEEYRADGWKWVETVLEIDWQALRDHGRVYPKKPELTDEQEAGLDRMAEEYDALAALIEEGAADEDAETALDELQAKMNSVEAEFYPPEAVAISGVVIGLNHHGEVCVERGLIKPEDKPKPEGAGEGANEGQEEEATPGLKHSAVLLEDLTSQKTAALRLELSNNPDIALAAVVHSMLLAIAYRGYERAHSALELSITSTSIEGTMRHPEDNLALEELARIKERVLSEIPKNPAFLWDWCTNQNPARLLELLAFAASHTVNAVEGRMHRAKEAAHANKLGQALGFEMTKYFEPTAKSYFGNLSRSSIEAAVLEAKGADFASGIAAMKKAEGAAYAEQQVRNSGWLPEPLRFGTADTVKDAGKVEQEDEQVREFPQAAE